MFMFVHIIRNHALVIVLGKILLDYIYGCRYHQIDCSLATFILFFNRLCEICGETAKNVSGVTTNGVMEEWNDRRFMDNVGNSSHRFGGCWRAQPFCNFLMACLVIAFIMPWFFHVNMF